MLRTPEGKQVFSGKKRYFSRSNQMHQTDQITEIDPYVRTYFWATIWYKHHGCNQEWLQRKRVRNEPCVASSQFVWKVNLRLWALRFYFPWDIGPDVKKALPIITIYREGMILAFRLRRKFGDLPWMRQSTGKMTRLCLWKPLRARSQPNFLLPRPLKRVWIQQIKFVRFTR